MNYNNLKKAYVFIALTSLIWLLLAFTITNILLKEQKNYSLLINKSGEQRMLSQKIALYIKRINENIEDNLLEEKNRLVNKMLDNQKFILENLQDSKILDIYLNKPYLLNKEIEEYLNFANSFDFSTSVNEYTNFYKKSEELLKKLDYAVTQIELNSDDKLEFFKEIVVLIFIFSFITIFLEIIYIVLPSFKKMKEVKELNEELSFLTENLQKQTVELEESYANEAELKANIEDITKKLFFTINEANAVVWNKFPLTGNIEYYYNDKHFGHKIEDVDTFEKWFAFVHPEDKQIILDSIERLESENKAKIIFRFKNEKDEYLWLELSKFVVERDFNGQIVEYSGFTQDITSAVLAEQKEKELQLKLENAQNLASQATLVRNYETDEIITSNNIHDVLGLSKDKYPLINKETVFDAIHPEDRDSYLQNVKKPFETNEPVEFVFRTISEDGNINYINCHYDVKIKPNKSTMSYVSLQNITQKVLDEEEKEKNDAMLIHQSRLAQLGEMVSMIAHQWKQPLNTLNISIGTLSILLKKDILDKEKILKIDERIQGIVQNLTQIIDDFRDFYKVKKIKEEFNFSTMLEKTLSIINHDLKQYKININKNIPKDLTLNSYENELSQVLIAILSNSIDVFKQLKKDEKFININLEVIDNELILTIKDNAGGIPNDVLPRIFEPYFSTKADLNGTGMGLYMSKMIIEKSFNGKIIASNEDDGAMFIIKMGGGN